jgi:hypothetical protein
VKVSDILKLKKKLGSDADMAFLKINDSLG